MGLSPPQYNIVMSLAHEPASRATTSGLAARLGVTVSFVVMETKRLEAKGLVSREADLKDRRRMHISLTKQARVALGDVAPLQRQVNDVLFSKLDRKSFKKRSAILQDDCFHLAMTASRSREVDPSPSQRNSNENTETTLANLKSMSVIQLLSLRDEVAKYLSAKKSELEDLMRQLGGGEKASTPSNGRRGQARGKVAAKYRHPLTGETWSGRGGTLFDGWLRS